MVPHSPMRERGGRDVVTLIACNRLVSVIRMVMAAINRVSDMVTE